jgi:hypothetical protein
VISKTGLSRCKWAMLMPLLLGCAITAAGLEEFATKYIFYHAVALCSCAWLLAFLDFDRRDIPVWLGLVTLQALYFYRFYFISLNPGYLIGFLPYEPFEALANESDALFEAFEASVIGFVSFSLSSAFLLARLKSTGIRGNPCPALEGEVGAALHRLMPKLILPILLPLMVVLAYLALRFQIGQMGIGPGEPLPFRLKGVIAYARIVLLPLLILQVICSGESSGQRSLVWVGLLLLLSHGLSDALIRSSRSSLLLVALLIVFLVMAGGLELCRRFIALACAVGVSAIALSSALTAYRFLRLRDGEVAMADVFARALQLIIDVGPSEIMEGVIFVAYRIPGVEHLWTILSKIQEPLGTSSFEIFSSPNGMAGHLTYTVYNADPTNLTLYAPGFFGWLYLVWGVPAIVIGSVSITIFSVLGWKYLCAGSWLSGPVARTFLLWMIFMALGEGNLDGMVFTVLVGVLTIVTLEIGLRISRRWIERRDKLFISA